MRKVACLSRVSTDEQYTSIKNQREILNNWISKNKDCVLYKHYIDEGISGTKAYKRVASLEMLEDGKNGKKNFRIFFFRKNFKNELAFDFKSSIVKA